MMKKFLATTLAIALTMGMSLTAFAAPGDTQLTKKYKLVNPSMTSPEETFKFAETADATSDFNTISCVSVRDGESYVTADKAPNLILGNANYAEGAATIDGAEAPVTVDFDGEFPGIGVYTYEFYEVTGNTAGVDYHDGKITLYATVAYDEVEGTSPVVVAIHTEKEIGDPGQKSSVFENTYSAGNLKVMKEVTGNMGEKQRDFDVIVSFAAPLGEKVNSTITYTDDGEEHTITPAMWENGEYFANVTLKHNETITFENVPYGVIYHVQEADYTTEEMGGYDAPEYSYIDGPVDEAEEVVTITNNKGIDVDTGIITDNMPYVVLLAIAFVGMVVFFMKKRSAVR